jgi:hypothetical protein
MTHLMQARMTENERMHLALGSHNPHPHDAALTTKAGPAALPTHLRAHSVNPHHKPRNVVLNSHLGAG